MRFMPLKPSFEDVTSKAFLMAKSSASLDFKIHHKIQDATITMIFQLRTITIALEPTSARKNPVNGSPIN
jgi:hypothetical protein